MCLRKIQHIENDYKQSIHLLRKLTMHQSVILETVIC